MDELRTSLCERNEVRSGVFDLIGGPGMVCGGSFDPPKSMKHLFPLFGFLVSIGSLSAGTPLLSVDFNAGARTPTPTMAGFQPFDVTVADASGPMAISFPPADSLYPSQITVSVTTGKLESDAGRMTGRLCKVDSSVANVPVGALYYDAICSSDGKPLLVSISGLKAGKSYTIDFFAFSSTRSGKETFSDVTSGEAADSAQLEWTSDFQFSDSTPEDQFQATMGATADSNGKIIISVTNKLGTPLLSGLRIAESKP